MSDPDPGRSSITVLDLFCGGGGLSEGFLQAGYDVVAGVDANEDFLATYEANHEDALAIQDAGCFMLEFEAVPAPIAALISAQLEIPTIGIGASAECDGQILVLEDMLGLNEWTPKFVKVYGDLGPAIERAVEQYAEEVKDRSFPGEDQVYR